MIVVSSVCQLEVKIAKRDAIPPDTVSGSQLPVVIHHSTPVSTCRLDHTPHQ